MKAAPALACALLACALLAAGPAATSLVPPGWSAKRRASDSTRLPLPTALVGPNRARGPARDVYPTRVTVSPSPARLGQRLAYRANLLVEAGVRVRLDRPQQGGDFAWGAPRTGRTSVTTTRFGSLFYGGVDSVWMEVPLQVFATGTVSIPGPAIEVTPRSGSGARAVLRMPTAHLVVLPTITAADTNAVLRALHGPLRAPWWERVPWRLVAAGALLVAALVGAIAWLRRRRKVAAPAPVAVRPQPARDPGAEALAELASLRRLRLPEAGRFADHAWGSTIAARENMYVRAADALGASTLRLLMRHILPNIMAPIIILFTTRVAAVILSEASLSFLGLGIPPPAPSWGGMLSGTGRQYMLIAPMMALIPGLCLTIVVYGINVFGDAMRDLLDPRLRGGGGSYSVRQRKKKAAQTA